MTTCMRRLLSVQSEPISRLCHVPTGRNDRTPEGRLEQARSAHGSAQRAGVEHPHALGFPSDEHAALDGLLGSGSVPGGARKFVAATPGDAEAEVEREAALDGAERFRRL